jgi:LysR family transcriptional regulator, carnitine catabolism transcriptional activator
MEFTSRQLRALLLVAQHRNFTRAAELMFITPSGLSVLIREFENELGFRLFNRTTRHVALTNSGNEMVKIAQESLQNLDAVAARIGHSVGEDNQSFSLGAPPLIAANIVAPAVREFRVRSPRLRVDLFDERAPILQQMVQDGKLDMGLGIFGPAASLRRALFMRFPLVVVRAERDQELKRGSITWSALKGEKIICLQSSSPIQQLVDRHLSRAGAIPSQRMPVNLLDTQVAMVEAGEGIAVVPSYAPVASRNRRVVISRLINPIVEVEFSLISYRGKKLPPVAGAFTDFLKTSFSRWAGSFQHSLNASPRLRVT